MIKQIRKWTVIIAMMSLMVICASASCFSTTVNSEQDLGKIVKLGSVESFGVLAYSSLNGYGINTITGNVGLSEKGIIFGLPQEEVRGTILIKSAETEQAQSELGVIFDRIRQLKPTAYTTGNIEGRVFSPGIYKSDQALSAMGTVTLDAEGNDDKMFIFIIEDELTFKEGCRVELKNGAQPRNVFWVAKGNVNIEKDGNLVGTIITANDILCKTNIKLEGRLLSIGGGVNLLNTMVTLPSGSNKSVPTVVAQASSGKLHISILLQPGLSLGMLGDAWGVQVTKTGTAAPETPVVGSGLLELDYFLSPGAYKISPSHVEGYQIKLKGVDASSETMLSGGDTKNVIITVTKATEAGVVGSLPNVTNNKITKVAISPKRESVGLNKAQKIRLDFMVKNYGNVPLGKLVIKDQHSKLLKYISGDANKNYLLDPKEIWVYSATMSVKTNMVYSVDVSAVGQGKTVTASTNVKVSVSK